VKIVVRKAVPGEEYDVNRVIIRTWKTSYRGLIDDGYLDALDEGDASRLDRLRSKIEDGCVCVASAGGGPIGSAVFGPAMDGERGASGELYSLYVLPEYQRSGAGRRLFGAVRGELRLRGYRTMIIKCLTGNSACRFYEKEGARPVGSSEHVLGGKSYGLTVFSCDI